MHLLLLPMLTGCKVVDAPEDIESLMVFGFANFDEDEAFLEETERQLIPLVEARLEELTKGYRVADLTAADLEKAGVAASNEGDIVGAMGTVDYRHNIDDIVDAVSRSDKDVMFPDNFLAYDVLDTSDRPCFLAKDCDRLDQEVFERAKVAILGEGERTYDSSYRWIEPKDLPRAVFIRQIAPEEMQFSSNLAKIHQQYSFVMLYEIKGVARRVEAFWVDATMIGMDVPDTFAVDNAVNAISSQAERIDNWIDENG